jgi:regulator of sirC expression with transglutaminase-like and TPR domain
LELNPELAAAYGGRGLVYKQLGQTEQAIADFERLLELTDNPQWHQMAEEQLRELRGE